MNIEFSRERLPISHPERAPRPLRYVAEVRELPGGDVLARTVDMQGLQEYCLGHLEDFLERVLNRDGVLRPAGEPAGRRADLDRVLFDSYSSGHYGPPESGKYVRTDVRGPHERALALLEANGCLLIEKPVSEPIAACPRGGERGSEDIAVNYLVGLYPHGRSWLAVYNVFRGSELFTTFRVEQRRADWTVARKWLVNVLPPADDTVPNQGWAEAVLEEEKLQIQVYSGRGANFADNTYWYTSRLQLTLMLPGVSE
ncbi:MAG: hypothetical protein U1F48_05590 [Burkholderiales bacterium]